MILRCVRRALSAFTWHLLRLPFVSQTSTASTCPPRRSSSLRARRATNWSPKRSEPTLSSSRCPMAYMYMYIYLYVYRCTYLHIAHRFARAEQRTGRKGNRRRPSRFPGIYIYTYINTYIHIYIYTSTSGPYSPSLSLYLFVYL